jgi:hypothetical protein
VKLRYHPDARAEFRAAMRIGEEQRTGRGFALQELKGCWTFPQAGQTRPRSASRELGVRGLRSLHPSAAPCILVAELA